MIPIVLVDSIPLPPQQTALVMVKVEEGHNLCGPLVMEPTRTFSGADGKGPQFGDSLVNVSEDSCAPVFLANPTGFTQRLEKGS